MSHAEAYEERIIQYADDELGDSERFEFEAHLVQCKACVDAVEEHRNAIRFVRAGMTKVPSANAMTVNEIRFRATARRRRVRVAAVAAGGLVVAASAFALLGDLDSQRPTPSDEVASHDDLELRVLEQRIALLEAQLERMQAETKRAAELAAMEAELSEREIAAIALAAARHLEESGLDVEGARRQYRLVIERFAHTPEAEVARQHLSAT